MTYANDYDDTLPPDLETLVRLGSASEKQLRAPGAPLGTVSYVYLLGGRKIGGVRDPARTVMAYEKPEWSVLRDKVNVLFADGHVERVTVEQMEELVRATKKQLEGKPR